MQVFFSEEDYRLYCKILALQSSRFGLDIWAYCLMPNHVHLVAVPSSENGLARPIGQTHQRYAREVNRRETWTGHLWQERFASFPMDESHLLAAIRYVLLNPVRSGLASSATDWAHSSARALILGEPDPLVNCGPCHQRINDWRAYLSEDPGEEVETLRAHGRIGRPLGSESFVKKLERMTGRCLRPLKGGRKPRNE